MVCFPYAPGKRFDHDYYARNHMPMVMDLCKAHGLIRYEIDRALAGGTPGSPPPFTCIGRLYFDTAQEFQSAMESHGPEILGDVPNYTDIALQIQVSEMAPS
jgi:uncharacterized protein (TIGR02118 family)